ncbi:uncharacterized protein LOC113467125 [Diaphorina citri]|uniref:Uncharacterized protein LOC113467125 n=1 Tax=Diaphorina citri TaxID=121845 RepID=A0A3Q0IWY6_DIACI|nr:uncharacterized protein LOC113467125 [Diaphorina citri]
MVVKRTYGQHLLYCVLLLKIHSCWNMSDSPSASCKASEFACDNGRCVPITKYCNSLDDCGDKSDEPRYCTPCNRTYYGEVGTTYEVELHRPKQEKLPFICHLIFTASGGSLGDLIQLSFESFTLGRFLSFTHDGCPDGDMQISEIDRPHVGGAWCGTSWSPVNYFSETHSLKVTVRLFKLSKDNSVYNFDFKIGYKMLNKSSAVVRYGESLQEHGASESTASNSTTPVPYYLGDLIAGTPCSRIFSDCDRKRCRLQSPNYPGIYARNLTCYYAVRQHEIPNGYHALVSVKQSKGQLIGITSQSRDVSRGGKSGEAGQNGQHVVSAGNDARKLKVWNECSEVQDYVTIYDGYTTRDPVLLRFCGGGTAIPEATSSGSELLVEFTTSPYGTLMYTPPMLPLHGFQLNVEVKFVEQESFMYAKNKRCEFWIRGSGKGTLESPRHSLSPNTTCFYHLQGKKKRNVEWVFLSGNLPVTTVILSAALVQTEWSSDQFSSGQFPKGKYTSNSTTPVPYYLGEHVPSSNSTTPVPYYLGDLIAGTPCSRIFSDCDRKRCRLQSPNYPGIYARNLTCYYAVRQHEIPNGYHALVSVKQSKGQLIGITSQSRDVSRGGKSGEAGQNGQHVVSAGNDARKLKVWNECSEVQDYVTIYDGYTTRDPVLLRFCGGGTAIPEATSSGSELLVEFTTSPYGTLMYTPPMLPLHGFQLNVEVKFVEQESFMYAKNKRCEFWIRGSGKGTLESPRHSLSPNTTCFYHLQGHEPGATPPTRYQELSRRKSSSAKIVHTRYRVWLSVLKYHVAPSRKVSPTESSNPGPPDCSTRLQIWDGNIRAFPACTDVYCDQSSSSSSQYNSNLTLLSRYCKDHIPKSCEHTLYSTSPRPCSLAESFLSSTDSLTLELTVVESTTLRPVSFRALYEFVDLHQDGDQWVEGAACSRKFTTSKNPMSHQSEFKVQSPKNVFLFGRGGSPNLTSKPAVPKCHEPGATPPTRYQELSRRKSSSAKIVHTRYRVWLSVLKYHVAPSSKVSPTETSNTGPPDCSTRLQIWDGNIRAFPACTDVYCDQSSSSPSQYNSNLTLLSRYCKDHIPKSCEHTLYSTSPRPCSLAESFLSSTDSLTLELTVVESTTLRPVSFRALYEFVDLHQDGDQWVEGAACSRKFTTSKNPMSHQSEFKVQSPKNVFLFGRGGYDESIFHCLKLFQLPALYLLLLCLMFIILCSSLLLIACRAYHHRLATKTVATSSLADPSSIASCRDTDAILNGVDYAKASSAYVNSGSGLLSKLLSQGHLPFTFVSHSNHLQLDFVLTHMNSSEDYRQLHFDATYEFIRSPVCTLNRRLSGTSGEIFLRSPGLNQEEINCEGHPWIIEPSSPTTFLYVKMTGVFLPNSNWREATNRSDSSLGDFQCATANRVFRNSFNQWARTFSLINFPPPPQINCEGHPWIIEPSSPTTFLYVKMTGVFLPNSNWRETTNRTDSTLGDFQCATPNRVSIHSGESLHTVVCPSPVYSQRHHIVEVFSEGWVMGSNAPKGWLTTLAKNESRNIVIDFIPREHGVYSVSWLELTRRPLLPTAQDINGPSMSITDCIHRCPELDACINASLWCDGIEHCPSGKVTTRCNYRFEAQRGERVRVTITSLQTNNRTSCTTHLNPDTGRLQCIGNSTAYLLIAELSSPDAAKVPKHCLCSFAQNEKKEDMTVVCPSPVYSQRHHIVEVFSEGWVMGSNAPKGWLTTLAKNESRNIVIDFIPREHGVYTVSWLELTRRPLLPTAQDINGPSMSITDCIHRCPELDACINASLWCDGIEHCPSGKVITRLIQGFTRLLKTLVFSEGWVMGSNAPKGWLTTLAKNESRNDMTGESQPFRDRTLSG